MKMEDLDIIYRRMSVIAYEDIGLANPSMGPRVDACINTCERLGLPEARIPLAVMVIDLALSPKSNSAIMALDAALDDIHNGSSGNVPDHIKTTAFGYKYPHDFPHAYVKQQYLPDQIKDHRYYKPKNTSKYETNLKNIYDNINRLNEKE